MKSYVINLLIPYILKGYKISLLYVESLYMALALLRESSVRWRTTLEKDESPEHKIKQQLLNQLKQELEIEKCSLYAALAFHVTLHRLQWQCSGVENERLSVNDYALAVASQSRDNREMWKRSIHNELWNIHESSPKISSALVKGWSSDSARKSLLQLLIPPDSHNDIEVEKIGELKRGSKTMIEIDTQVKKYLEEQGPFPQLWTWFTKKPLKPETLSMILSSNQKEDFTREVQFNMKAVDRKELESSCLHLVIEIWDEILRRKNPPEASNRIDEIDPNVNKDSGNISNTISGPNAKKDNNSDTILGPEDPDNNPRNDVDGTISVGDSLEKLESQVGMIKTSYEDYEQTVKFLGPRGSVPEWLQKKESTIKGMVSQSTKLVEWERIVTSTSLVRDMANKLIIGGLSSIEEGSDNEFSEPARMMITILAEILLYNRNGDGDRICSCIIILLSGKLHQKLQQPPTDLCRNNVLGSLDDLCAVARFESRIYKGYQRISKNRASTLRTRWVFDLENCAREHAK